jgi:glucose/mannose transport system substrate-binding protein
MLRSAYRLSCATMLCLIVAPLCLIIVSTAATAQTADVAHWWTSGGESKAIAVIANEYRKRGGTWVDSAVVGGAAQYAQVMNRLAGGNPPTAAQWRVGPPVIELAQQGLLRNLDDIAQKGNWDHILPPLIVKEITYDHHYYGAPVDIDAVNRIFYSTKIFNELKISPPQTWDEFFSIADKIKAAGYIPLAQAASPNFESMLFESVMFGVGGKDFYRKIFVDHDANAARSDAMVRSFEVLRRLTHYVDDGATNRKWNDTAILVEQNKAAMQVIGDFAKGEFRAAGLTIGKDFGCAPAPGTAGGFIAQMDVFIFPKINKPDAIAAQRKLAEVIMDPVVQVNFNATMGTLPVRTDVDVTQLDACSQQAQKVIAADPTNLVPTKSISFSSDVEGQFDDLIGHFWITPGESAEQAAAQLAGILGNAKN